MTGETQGIPFGICERLFELAATHLESGRQGFLIESGRDPMPRIGDQSWHGVLWNDDLWSNWLWDEDPAGDLYGRTFRFVVEEHALGPLTGATDATLDEARLAQRLMEAITPGLAQSVASHTQTIAVFDPVGRRSGIASSSQYRLSGMVFINRHMFRNPWQAAEHLFHECLHQKLYDLRSGHTLLSPDFEENNEPLVCSLWNTPGVSSENIWNTHRAMAAFHVYAHLAVMAAKAEANVEALEAEFGPRNGMISSRQAIDRARHLGLELREQCGHELGPAGEGLVDWLTRILDVIDDEPGRIGARSHLLIGRYLKEAKNLSSVFQESEATAKVLAHPLGALAREELSSAEEILNDIAGPAAALEALQAGAGLSELELGLKFPEIRGKIARIFLREFAREAGGGFADLDRDGRLASFIEAGSERLLPLTKMLPPLVVAAHRRAHALNFGQSCTDQTGRLLATLAAGLPANARVLEIGTAAGVGLAWIVAGLAERCDVEVVSVEGNSELFESTVAAPWPSYVCVLAGDATALIGRLGEFDLVFADASPWKFENPSALFGALAPGGTLLVDDLHDPSSSAEAQADHQGLKAKLLAHPELQGVFLEWSTGLLLASRRAAGAPVQAAGRLAVPVSEPVPIG